MTALFVLWSGHDLMIGLAKSPEGKARVFRESLVAYFHLEQPDSLPIIGAKPESLRNAAAPSPSDNSSAQPPQIQVVESEPAIDDSRVQLRKAADFHCLHRSLTLPRPCRSTRATQGFRIAFAVRPRLRHPWW